MGESIKKTKTLGTKYDQEKINYDLIPPLALEGIAQVFTYGCKKYGIDNWKHVTPKSRYMSAAFRHLQEVRKNKMIDEESKLLHIDHAITSLMMYRELSINKK